LTIQPHTVSSSRRAFLRRAALIGIALPSLADVLAACTGGTGSALTTSGIASDGGGGPGDGGIEGAAFPLARPDAPVTWDVDESQLIASDLPPEDDATVKILSWPSYLAPSLVASFEKKYTCRVDVATFSDMNEGLAKMASDHDHFDLMVGMTLQALGRSIAAGWLRPLNLDYVPNLANCWSSFQDPFYDVGSRFSVPYSVWSTGIFWRNDKIVDDIASMANPYDFFWNGAPVDKTHLLSNTRDVLSMSMFREGLVDVNVSDTTVITAARDAMADVAHATNASFDHVDDIDVATGRAYLHQSRSGSVSRACILSRSRAAADNLSFVWPVTSGVPGNVDSDTLVMPNSGQVPVLAHRLLNHILDANNAMTSFATYVGYQMPQNAMTREALVQEGPVPEHLTDVYIVESDMGRGSRELELPPVADALWQAAYRDLSADV